MDAILSIDAKYRRLEEAESSALPRPAAEEEHEDNVSEPINALDLRTLLKEEEERLMRLRNRDIGKESLRTAKSALEILSASAAKSRLAGLEAYRLEASEKVSAGIMRAEVKAKKRSLETSLRLVQRWRSAWELGECVAGGDESALRELESRVESAPELQRVLERASVLLREKARSQLESAAEAMHWPLGSSSDWLSADLEPQYKEGLLRAVDTAFRAKKGHDSKPFEILEARIHDRFHFFFLQKNVANEATVAARWLARVYRESLIVLLGTSSQHFSMIMMMSDHESESSAPSSLKVPTRRRKSAIAAAQCIHRCILNLSRQHVSHTLPFQNLKEADSFVEAYRELERTLEVRAGGPLALIGDTCLDAWLTSDRMALTKLVTDSLDDSQGSDEKLMNQLCFEPLPGHLEAPFFAKRCDQRSYELVMGLLRCLDRAATLEYSKRRLVAQNIIETTVRALREWARPRLRKFGLDELVAIIADRLAGQLLHRLANAWQSWFAACSAIRFLLDVHYYLVDQWPGYNEDEYIVTSLNITTPLTDDATAFSERLAQLAAAGSAQSSLGPRAGFWIRAFLTEIKQRLPEIACLKSRNKLADIKLTDLLTAARADDSKLLAKATLLAEAFAYDDSTLASRFTDVATLTTLDSSKRRTLIRAFEALCLEEDHHNSSGKDDHPQELSDPRARKRRLLALDAALNKDSDDAIVTQLTDMLATVGVYTLAPRPAATVLVATDK